MYLHSVNKTKYLSLKYIKLYLVMMAEILLSYDCINLNAVACKYIFTTSLQILLDYRLSHIYRYM